jgi:hypothetical protein
MYRYFTRNANNFTDVYGNGQPGKGNHAQVPELLFSYI